MNPSNRKIEALPTHPGVYLFKDKRGAILYIGKAGNIKHRVSSYFQKPAGKDLKTLTMLEKVADIETIITDTEKEAFILENNLIKEHHPRYNVKLRDDKNYPCLRLSIGEEFPTLTTVRHIKKNHSLYFGPYPSATSLKETLRLIRKLFPIRTCLHTKFSNRLRPCINYNMGNCFAPCCGKVDAVQYREMIHQVRMFLEGRNRALIERLKKNMEEESEQLHFENAAKIRDQIGHIEKVLEKQRIISGDFLDQDVIGFYRQNHSIIVHPLFVRAGKLLGGKGYPLSSSGLPDQEILSSFLYQYYRKGKFIPKQILIPMAVPEQSSIEQWLTELKGEKVRLLTPLRGDKRHLLQMACDNAEKYLLPEIKLEEDRKMLLETMKEKLRLKKIPRRIEAFDISHFQGGYAVGAMVTFEDGECIKERYRHFKIKTIKGVDDYGMMYEILFRRYQRALKEDDLPNLVLLDGGRGQLNVAQEVFKELMIKEVDLLSLAKERMIEGPPPLRFGKTEEKIFHPQSKEPIILEKQSLLLHLLDRIRDEAHRFAITYHKKLTKKETIQSILEKIPGIGVMRQKALLKFFGSVEKIKKATMEELAHTPKINLKSAQMVYDFFHASLR